MRLGVAWWFLVRSTSVLPVCFARCLHLPSRSCAGQRVWQGGGGTRKAEGFGEQSRLHGSKASSAVVNMNALRYVPHNRGEESGEG